MQVSLIDIGTSKGIRIPASILKEMDTPLLFELHIEDGRIILDTIEEPRKGWDKKFQQEDDALLIDDALDMDAWDEI